MSKLPLSRKEEAMITPLSPHYGLEKLNSVDLFDIGKSLNQESVRGSNTHESSPEVSTEEVDTPAMKRLKQGDKNQDSSEPVPEEALEEGGQKYDEILDSFNQKTKKLPEVGISRMMREMWPERVLIFSGMFALQQSSVMNQAMPLIQGRFVDDLSNRRYEMARTLILVVVIIAAGMAQFNFINMSCLWLAGHKVTTRLRLQLFKCVLYREVAFFDSTRSGDLLSRVNGDVYAVNQALTTELADIVHRSVMFLGSLAYMFYLSWDMTLISIALAPFLGFVGHRLAIFFHSIARKANEENARANIVAEESISSIRTIKALAQERSMLSRYFEHVMSMYDMSKKTTFAKAGQRSFVYCVGTLAVTFVLWLGTVRVQNGMMTAGGLLTFVLLSLQVGEKSGQILDNWGCLKTAAGSSQRAFELIDEGEEHLAKLAKQTYIIPNGQYNQLGEKVGESNTVMAPLQLSNIVFEYPTRPGKIVLNDVSLVLKPGTTIALVGPSGGGKSSTIALIERYYLPKRGTVKWANVDVHKLDPEFYHKHIGYVGQEPVLFCTNVRDNVLFGVCYKRCDILRDENGQLIVNEDTILCYDYHGKPYTQRDVENACKAANAHSFVSQWPQGYNTVVGEATKTLLSGGQKQRLAIARCILMNPPILILDEATSALDSESEQAVQQALEVLMKGKTTLMIAHRQSTTRNCDYIAVIAGGRIVEYGSPNELLRIKDGHYAELVNISGLNHAGEHGLGDKEQDITKMLDIVSNNKIHANSSTALDDVKLDEELDKHERH